jgi:hypothetical protein
MPTEVICGFFSDPPVLQNLATAASFRILTNLLLTYYSLIRRYVVLVSKNTLSSKLQVNKYILYLQTNSVFL